MLNIYYGVFEELFRSADFFGKCRVIRVVSDRAAKNLPYHFLGIQFRIIGRQEQKREPRISFQAFLYDLSMMKADVIENHNNRSPGIAFSNRGKECEKCFRVSCISDPAGQDAIF